MAAVAEVDEEMDGARETANELVVPEERTGAAHAFRSVHVVLPLMQCTEHERLRALTLLRATPPICNHPVRWPMHSPVR